MKRVIYSLYIDIPKEDLDWQPSYAGDNLTKTERTKIEFAKHYERLLECKKEYADKIGVDFVMFEYDEQYKEYHKFFRENYPEITAYNIVNFYKIHLMYELAKEYDEVLYLDFDVVPNTEESFFERWDLSQGIAILDNNDQVHNGAIQRIQTCVRSPTAKKFNCSAMLMERDVSPRNDVFNTGIVGASREHLKQLGYFDDFRDTLDLMTWLRENPEESIWGKNITDLYGYDNETVWSYKVKMTDTPIVWLDEQWHYFFSGNFYIPRESKMIHAISKQFDRIWEFLNDTQR